MEMLMGVDMVKLKTRGTKSLELGLDLSFELIAHFGKKKHRRARTSHIRAKIPAFVDQIWDRCGRQYRFSFNQDEMKPHTQGW